MTDAAEHPRTEPATTDDGGGTSSRHYRLMLAIAAVWIALDQLTKWWAERSLDTPIDVIGSLRFNLAYNTGTAFSLGSTFGPIIAVLAVVIVVVLLRAGRTVTTTIGVWALGMVLGGAIGNLLDRVLNARDGFLDGAVVDFIDLQWWPIFNIADIGIVVGGVLLVLTGIRHGDEH
ncbi:MAG: signal peptidase II [Actinomycetota bacterium]|nr:signal peptidase II [Actinomycetota bacterium]